MVEIIILIFLARDLGKLAVQKGLKPSTWQIYLVAGWVLAELIGVMVGVMMFGLNNIITVILIAIAFAFSSYFVLRSMLEKYPDSYNDDINNIGK